MQICKKHDKVIKLCFIPQKISNKIYQDVVEHTQLVNHDKLNLFGLKTESHIMQGS